MLTCLAGTATRLSNDQALPTTRKQLGRLLLVSGDCMQPFARTGSVITGTGRLEFTTIFFFPPHSTAWQAYISLSAEHLMYTSLMLAARLAKPDWLYSHAPLPVTVQVSASSCVNSRQLAATFLNAQSFNRRT